MDQSIDFLEFTNHLKGYKVFTEQIYSGRVYRTRKYNYILYWQGVTPKEIFTNSIYIVEKR